MELNINIDKNFFNNLGAMFAHKKSDGVVGIDIGSAFVHVVQLHKKNGKAVLDTYGEIALGPLAELEVGQSANLPPEKIADAINDLFVEAKVTSRNLIFSLPLTSALVSVIELPDLGPEKIKEMIPIEARKFIPMPINEVTISHFIIPPLARTYIDPDKEEKDKQSPRKAEVLIVAIHNDILERYKQIATKLGDTSAAFEIEIFSSIRSTFGRDVSPTMLLDIGAGTTKAVIVEEGIVRSSHSLSVGSQDVTLALARAKGISILEAEELKREYGLEVNPEDSAISEITRLAVERILTEAQRIINNYENTNHVSVAKVVLVGGGALVKDMRVVASQNLGREVVLGSAFEKVEAPAVITPLLADAGPEFATAIGLALRSLS